ncbi:Protein of uncharacterised function (DUF421) [Legionella beliardensis]|uniref:Protein of uncharacterized function (DUF421) n=1 Tax=Legionella beliardensis TaxID=91822 RepID=A0A378I1F2_9GAMM|nr:YetF domain-containing protein [Legionella beliardensis]STX28505.1 Protein of uncharacterised function (DUF421) [Legionella beliardensis]
MKISDILNFELYFRTSIVTLYALALFRAGSSRLLGKYSPLDLIITIVIGAVLGASIVGTLPLISSLVSTGLIVIIHRGLLLISFKYSWVERFIRGNEKVVVKDGKYIEKNLQKTHLTAADVLQALRVQQGEINIKKVYRSFVESDGRISFIMSND